MKATVEKIDQHSVVIEIEVDEKRMEVAYQKAYKKVVQKILVPGFRKGKAPRVLLEARFGKEILFEEAVEIIVPEAYMEAVNDQKIEPIEQPKIEVVQLQSGQPFIFKATVMVKPEVILGEYKGIEVEVAEAVVADEEVDRQLQSLQKRHARIRTLGEEETAEMGDTLIIDFVGYRDDVPFEGGEGDDYSLELGSSSFIPGFEEGLVGTVADQAIDLNLTFPAEYHVPDLAGQDVVFKVKVKEIKRRELSPIDDEFAMDVSEFDSLEELKADIRGNLLKSAAETEEKKRVNKIVAIVADNATVDVPNVLVDQEVEDMVAEYGRRLEYQGLTLEKFLELTGQTQEGMKEKLFPEAKKTVIQELVLEAVAKAEGLEVTEEEIDREIEVLAEQYHQKPQALRKMMAEKGQLDGIHDSLLLKKATFFITSQGTIAAE